MNRVQTAATLITLSLTSLVSAQPMVRPTLNGLTYLNSNQAFLQEPWTTRVPHTIPCPYTATAPYLNYRRAELVDMPLGGNPSDPWPCSWTISVLGDGTYPLRIVAATGPYALAWAYDHTTYDLHPDITLSPCNIDLSTTAPVFNVLDFITFLNAPYDWNGDGTLNVFDFNDFDNYCSSN